MERPKCRRCGGPLDIWHDPDNGVQWHCNNHKPLADDEEFKKRWDNLPGDDVARLERLLEEK